MYADAAHDPITSRDRLVTTLCFALLLHGLVIFGVVFTADDAADAPGTQTLEIVLVNAPTDDAPEHADYLADAAQRGAGNIDERVRARSPEARVGDPDARAESGAGPAPVPGRFDERRADHRPLAAATDDPLVSSRRDNHLRFALALRAGSGTAAAAAYGAELLLPSIPADTSAHAALAYSDTPRERFISVNTQEALYAAYLHGWRERVERVGNLNYPDEARRRGLSGALELEVALGAGGRVRQLRVRRGSGHRVLDDAALRIVYMAAPFAPFPDDLKREVDVLRFTFVWEFGDGQAGARVRAAAGPRR